MKTLKNILAAVLKSLSYFLLFLSLVFVTTETWFRIVPLEIPLRYYRKTIDSRLWPLWLNEKNTNPLMPPYKIFSNEEYDNEERLERIAKETRLPSHTRLSAYDFLRPASLKEKTRYVATINNLGFRDPPRTVEKPKNVFRIIVLGSYHAFGHAVNDEDTYSRQLERMLNEQKINGITFEVWNGGRHAASAIVGLAKLKTEVLNYHPDLIILDYGFVDGLILGDDFFPVTGLLPDTGIFRLINGPLRLIRNQLAAMSQTFSRIMDYVGRKNFSKNIDRFQKVIGKILEVTQENNIPVILMRQTIVNPNLYKDLRLSERAVLVDGRDIFKKYPPSTAVIEEFVYGENWFSEFDPALAEKDRRWRPPMYFKDIFQYNEAGHEAIARYLANEIGSALAEK